MDFFLKVIWQIEINQMMNKKGISLNVEKQMSAKIMIQ